MYGVRLGRMERWMLLHAPVPRSLSGLVLDAEDPSVREGQRRAAVKLERVGLLEREQAVLYVAAQDARRERLVFRDGQFWRRRSAERRHAVRRTIVWLSPLGSEIEHRFRAQLVARTPIRWDERTVAEAQMVAHQQYGSGNHREQRRTFLEALEEQERARALAVDRDANPLEPAVPGTVHSSGDHERWMLAAAIADDRSPVGGADAAWDLACALYEGLGIKPLREAAAKTRSAQRAGSKAQRFRDQRATPPRL